MTETEGPANLVSCGPFVSLETNSFESYQSRITLLAVRFAVLSDTPLAFVAMVDFIGSGGSKVLQCSKEVISIRTCFKR